MERITQEADFGLEDWEETLFFVKSDPNGAYNILDIAKYQGESEFDEILKNIALRLAAYENTDLEPEEIARIMNAYGRGMTLRTENAQRLEIVKDIQTDRLRELAQADREGRCVVLPCKVGDTIWRIVKDANPHITKDKCTDILFNNQTIWIRLIGTRTVGSWNFGETLFSTKEDAEAALRREQDG